MSVNLTAHKAVFIKPDKKGRVINLHPATAVATIFTPSNATLSEIFVLVNNANTTGTTVYTMAIVAMDDGVPAITDLSDLSSSGRKVEVTVQPSPSGISRSWIKFPIVVTFTEDEIDTEFAIVITSDADASTNNGVLFTEVKYPINASVSKSFIFNNTTKEWAAKSDNNSDIAVNLFYCAEEVDGSTALDTGSVSTSGTDSLRGYEVFLAVRNDAASSAAKNVILYPSRGSASLPVGATEQSFAEETYLAPGRWFRYDADSLPATATQFSNLQKDALDSPIPALEPGQFVLFVQNERVYPFPKPFMLQSNTGTSLGGGSVENLNFGASDSPNNVVISQVSSAEVVIQQDIGDFKHFILTDKNFIKDGHGQLFPVGSASPIVGSYIRSETSGLPNDGYLITGHENSSQVTIRGRRVYPAPDYSSLFVNPGSINQAIISSSDLSSIHCSGFPESRFNLNTRGRFYDPKATSGAMNWEFVFGRLFPTPVVTTASVYRKGDVFGASSGTNQAQIPYFILNNIINPTTEVGNHIQSVGFALFSGNASHSSYSTLVPELADTEAITLLGIMDKDEYFESGLTGATGSISRAQGLVLVSHHTQQVSEKDLINAYIVRKIDNTGIQLIGRCVSTGYFTTVAQATSTTCYVTFPKHRFSSAQITELVAVPTYFVPNQYKNKYLSEKPYDAQFLIMGGYEHTLIVRGTVDTIKTACNFPSDSNSFSSLKKVPCLINYPGATYPTTGALSTTDGHIQIALFFDNSSSVIGSGLYVNDNRDEIKGFIDAVVAQHPTGTVEWKIETAGTLTGGTEAWSGAWTTSAVTIKTRLDSLFATPTPTVGTSDDADNYDYAFGELADISTTPVFTTAGLKFVFTFGDNDTSEDISSETLALITSSGIVFNGYQSAGISRWPCLQQAAAYSNGRVMDSNTSTMTTDLITMLYRDVPFVDGRSFGIGKYNSTAEFFQPYDTDNVLYGQYFGVSNFEIADGKNSYLGLRLDSGGVVAPTGPQPTLRLFFQTKNTSAAYLVDTFYNEFNRAQIRDFITRVFASNSDRNVQIFTFQTEGGPLYSNFGSGNERDVILDEIDNLWLAAQSAIEFEHADVVAALEEAQLLDWPGDDPEGSITIVFGDNAATNDVSDEFAAAGRIVNEGITNLQKIHYVRIPSAKSTGQAAKICDGLDSVYTTVTGNIGLSDTLTHITFFGRKNGYVSHFPPQGVRAYSLVIPFALESHEDSLNAFLDNNPLSVTKRYITDGTEVAYEVIQSPVHEWALSANKYSIYKPFEAPKDSSKIALSGSNFALFTFYDDGNNENTFDNNNSYVRELLSGYDFDSLSFTYRINFPSTTNISSVKDVRVVIQVANDKRFLDTDYGTVTLFDGVINPNPSTITSRVVSNHVQRVAGYALPDGQNLFLVDLRNAIPSGSQTKFLRIYMERTINTTNTSLSSIAKSVSVQNLRAYQSTYQTNGGA